MHKEAFDTLKNIENTWWHKGRIMAVQRALELSLNNPNGPLLDVGTGFGSMLTFLKSFGEVDGVEIDDQARNHASKRGYKKMYSEIVDIPNSSYGTIGAFDVIEHVKDDVSFVRQLSSISEENGLLLATVPAFPFLYGPHDELHMHYRRYTKKDFVSLLEDAGFSVAYTGYWNRTLFPLAALLRIFGKGGESGLNPPRFVEMCMLTLMRLESKSNFPYFPFGLSIVVVATKHNE